MSDDLIHLSDVEFKTISSLLFDHFGIWLGDQKKILVAGRLSKRLRVLGLSNFTEYTEYLLSDSSGSELSEMINRITTNHTYFFREREHYDFLQKTILPELDKKIASSSTTSLRFWSAGCATGEEVYSLAMLLREYYGERLKSIDYGLLATDISLKALEEARLGAYQEHKLRELPKHWQTWFSGNASTGFTINNSIREMVLFKRLNLMSKEWPMKGSFDLIFCRNVMIYFNQESRKALIDKFFEYIKPGGWLFIGHSESLKREECPFTYIKPAIYRKEEDVQLRNGANLRTSQVRPLISGTNNKAYSIQGAL
jgi:chemotaxis protein methyltransferase CheR